MFGMQFSPISIDEICFLMKLAIPHKLQFLVNSMWILFVYITITKEKDMSENENNETEKMTPWHLIELIEKICASQSLDENKKMFLEIVEAAEERHDEDVGDCLRDLFAEWIGIDSMEYPNPPSGEELRGMFPTLVLCCTTDDFDWMCRRRHPKKWESNITNSTWEPTETVTLESLREALRIACYTTDRHQYDKVSCWLQSMAEKARGDCVAHIVHDLFFKASPYAEDPSDDRVVCLQSQYAILAHFCKIPMILGEVLYLHEKS